MGEAKNREEEGRREDMDLDLLHNDPSSFNGSISSTQKGSIFKLAVTKFLNPELLFWTTKVCSPKFPTCNQF
jgi:hypothetical protein